MPEVTHANTRALFLGKDPVDGGTASAFARTDDSFTARLPRGRNIDHEQVQLLHDMLGRLDKIAASTSKTATEVKTLEKQARVANTHSSRVAAMLGTTGSSARVGLGAHAPAVSASYGAWNARTADIRDRVRAAQGAPRVAASAIAGAQSAAIMSRLRGQAAGAMFSARTVPLSYGGPQYNQNVSRGPTRPNSYGYGFSLAQGYTSQQSNGYNNPPRPAQVDPIPDPTPVTPPAPTPTPPQKDTSIFDNIKAGLVGLGIWGAKKTVRATVGTPMRAFATANVAATAMSQNTHANRLAEMNGRKSPSAQDYSDAMAYSAGGPLGDPSMWGQLDAQNDWRDNRKTPDAAVKGPMRNGRSSPAAVAAILGSNALNRGQTKQAESTLVARGQAAPAAGLMSKMLEAGTGLSMGGSLGDLLGKLGAGAENIFAPQGPGSFASRMGEVNRAGDRPSTNFGSLAPGLLADPRGSDHIPMVAPSAAGSYEPNSVAAGGGAFHALPPSVSGGAVSPRGVTDLPISVGGDGPKTLNDLIEQEAKRAGIDPKIMYGIRKGESKNSNEFDKGDANDGGAYGPWQFNMGKGRFGDEYQKKTGRDPSDPKNIPHMTRYMAEFIAEQQKKNPNYAEGGDNSELHRVWHGFHGKSDADPKWGTSGYVPEDTGPKTSLSIPGMNNGGVRSSMDDVMAAANKQGISFPQPMSGAAGTISPDKQGQIVGSANQAKPDSYWGDPSDPSFKKEHLTTITLNSGKKVVVNTKAAESYKGFLNELEGSGYKINSLGGYADRDNVNSPGKRSMHAYGDAIDVNPGSNPNTHKGDANYGQTDMPDSVRGLAAKYGISWGHDWNSVKDSMHFEYAGQKAEGLMQRDASGKPIAPGQWDPTGGGFSPKYAPPTTDELNMANNDAYRGMQNPFMRHASPGTAGMGWGKAADGSPASPFGDDPNKGLVDSFKQRRLDNLQDAMQDNPEFFKNPGWKNVENEMKLSLGGADEARAALKAASGGSAPGPGGGGTATISDSMRASAADPDTGNSNIAQPDHSADSPASPKHDPVDSSGKTSAQKQKSSAIAASASGTRRHSITDKNTTDEVGTMLVNGSEVISA